MERWVMLWVSGVFCDYSPSADHIACRHLPWLPAIFSVCPANPHERPRVIYFPDSFAISERGALNAVEDIVQGCRGPAGRKWRRLWPQRPRRASARVVSSKTCMVVVSLVRPMTSPTRCSSPTYTILRHLESGVALQIDNRAVDTVYDTGFFLTHGRVLLRR